MTDSERSLSEVPGLIEERRRYEGWLAALEARKESTPSHVFERVQADYRARLQRVAEQLASYRQAIDEERTSVQARVALLEAEEQLRRDERAELELRAHVGELTGDEAGGAFSAVDQQIERLVGEKDKLMARISELQALLDEGVQPPAAALGNVPESKVGAAPDQPVGGGSLAAAPARSAAEAGALAATQTAVAQGKNGSFDELAFLSSVAGRNESERPEVRRDAHVAVERRSNEPIRRPSDNDERTAESMLAGIDKAKRSAGDAPLAASMTGNSPAVLRPNGTMEQAKTLKCNECTAMNYPTEWYCERCGAELAAL